MVGKIDFDYSLRSWGLIRRPLVLVKEINFDYSLRSWILTGKPLFMVGEIGLMKSIKCSLSQWGSDLISMGFG